jgi:hypothetical protein
VKINMAWSWERRAMAGIVNFVCALPPDKKFLAEQMNVIVEEQIGEPRFGQAWGPVMKRAESAGIVVQDGFRLAANGRPASVWRRGPST